MKQDYCQPVEDVLHRVIQRHKTSMKNRYESLFEGFKTHQNKTILNRIYTQLYILEGESEGVNEEHEVLQIEKKPRNQHWQDTSINCLDIFKPVQCTVEEMEEDNIRALITEDYRHEERTEDNSPQLQKIMSVMTKGIAGIGKTVSVQKFILDWAEGKANQDVDLIFVFQFRELNLIKDHQYSLQGLLCDFHPELKDLHTKTYDECKMVFIFDGLDESRIPLNFLQSEKVTDITKVSSVDLLMTNLIKGELLPSAHIWLTSRPAAANQIPSQYINRVTEIQGFNDPQKEEYFRKRISDQDQADSVISHIKKTRSLHIMCHIPVFCWISATVLQHIMKQGHTEIPKTLTAMYSHFLWTQTIMRSEKYEDRGERSPKDLLGPNRKILLKLAELAFKQLMKGNVMFYEEDLRGCGIDVTEASVYSGICTEIFREESVLHQRKVYCFVHLSFQEFLAALYVFHCYVSKNRKGLQCFKTQDTECSDSDPLEELQHFKTQDTECSDSDPLEELQRFKTQDTEWSESDPLEELQCFMTQDTKWSESDSLEKLQCLKTQDTEWSDSVSLEKLLRGAICKAIESENGHLDLFLRFLLGISLESNQQLLKDLLTQTVSSSESIKETVQYIKDQIETEDLPSDRSINLFLCLTEMNDQSLSSSIQEYLKSEKSSRKKLSPAECSALGYMLVTSEEVLDELNLKNYRTSERGYLRLIPAVTNCRKAILAGYKLTMNCYETICAALKSTNSPLKELDLSYTGLQDSEMNLLSDALKSPNCKLEVLRLAGCKLTMNSCEMICSALKSTNSPLKELDLSYTGLQDSKINLLSAALKSSNCKLEVLRLAGCKLTMSLLETLSTALMSANSLLKELDLINSDLQDSGVNLLSAGLKSLNCKLEILRSIFDNIHLIWAVLDVYRLLGLKTGLLFLDQEKAFDRVEHWYLWTVLENLGFNSCFIAMIKVLYSGIESVLEVSGGLSGFRIPNCCTSFCVSAYADDIVAMVGSQAEVDVLSGILNDFQVLSSAKVNWGESEAFLVGEWKGEEPRLPDGLHWKKGDPLANLADVQAMLVDFFWDRLHWLPQGIFYLPKDEGGQELVHLASRTAVFRLQFIERMLTGSESIVWRIPVSRVLQTVEGHGLDRAMFLLDTRTLDFGGLPVFYKGLFKIWELFILHRESCSSLYWLMEEPLVNSARLDISSQTSHDLSRILIAAGVTKLGQLVGLVGPELTNRKNFAAQLGIRSLRVARQLLHKYSSALMSDERPQESAQDQQTGTHSPSSPNLGDCGGPLLECTGEADMVLGAANSKHLYRACVKVINRKRLDERVETPWRRELGLRGDTKSEWRVLYKPPITKKAADLQWRVLHGVVSINSFISVLNPEVSREVDHGGEIRMKPGLKKYSCELTLNPNTAHRLLSLCEENRKVSIKTMIRNEIIDKDGLRYFPCAILVNSPVKLSITNTKEEWRKFYTELDEHTPRLLAVSKQKALASAFSGYDVLSMLACPVRDSVVRRLKRFGMDPRILRTFYTCTVESILTGSITTWYGSCTAIERKALQRVVRTAKYITGVQLPNFLDLYTSRCLRKTRKILKDSAHPSHCLFSQLPSGRRFRRMAGRVKLYLKLEGLELYIIEGESGGCTVEEMEEDNIRALITEDDRHEERTEDNSPQFRELNLIKDDQYSLQGLLCDFHPELKDLDTKTYDELDLLMTNLIKGELLPSALIWITARPAAANQIPSQYINRVTEIQGFNDPQKEEYFKKRISDQDQANSTIMRSEKYEDRGELMKGNVVFYEEDLRECGIDVTEASVYSGICTEIFREESVLHQRKVYCFVHLSFQEFLAALYVFHCYVSKNMEELQCLMTRNTKWPHRVLLGELLREATCKALESENGHLDLFLRFLLGISLKFNQQLLKDLLTQTVRSSESIKKTAQYIKHIIQSEDLPSGRSINLFLCLTEMNDQSLSSNIQEYLKSEKSSEKKLSTGECSALAYMLVTSEEVLDELNLKNYRTSEEGYLRLVPAVSNCRKAVLAGCKLTMNAFETLGAALKSTNLPLKILDLSSTDPQDSGVKLLSDGLKSSNCKLEILRLSGCLVTEEGCSYLASALSENPSHLKELDLSYNHPGDTGVKLLSARLEDPHCRLDTLRVEHEGEIRMKPGLKKYSCELTLDPNTVNGRLSLCEGNRKVVRAREEQSYPDHPERFDVWEQVLCRESLTGRCYWEAEWSGRVYIAVTYKVISRKGGERDCGFGLNIKSWCLFCSNNSYSVCHNNNRTAVSAPSSQSNRVGVYLDCPAGTLSFYSVSTDPHTLTHLHTVYTTFTEPLYAGFRLYTDSSVCVRP
ncbi:hypothetical protein NFI96_019599 [Prochilodus magdalenae]|nr:hypothetical protein NFI96_019599 [Prochilodus magdalenae]